MGYLLRKRRPSDSKRFLSVSLDAPSSHYPLQNMSARGKVSEEVLAQMAAVTPETETLVAFNANGDRKIGHDRWCALREAWKKPNPRAVAYKSTRVPDLDVDSVVDALCNPARPRLPMNVPLGEMISILNEMWESEGLLE